MMKNLRFNPIYGILVAYVAFIIFGYQLTQNALFIDIIKPIFFVALAFYAYKVSGNYHGRFKRLKDNMKTMIIMAIIYILVFSLSGLVVGFSYSIYSHSPLIILKNIYQTTFIIVLIEYLRSYLINQNAKSRFSIVATTIIFILLEINFGVLFSKFNDGKTAFEYVLSIIVPLIFSSAAYSYLALKGGYRLTIPYRVIISLFILITPVVPAFDWFLTGVFGSIFPAVIFTVIRKYSKNATTSRRENKKSISIAYLICLGAMVAFTLFVYGLFKYKPIVVLSNSMVPVFSKGDVVIYYEPDEEEKNHLENNTIVVYNKDNQYVVHRIVRSFKRAGEVLYITRGDANNSDDYLPVSTEDIVGVYTSSAKYVGYPSLWLNQIFNKTEAKVETK